MFTDKLSRKSLILSIFAADMKCRDRFKGSKSELIFFSTDFFNLLPYLIFIFFKKILFIFHHYFFLIVRTEEIMKMFFEGEYILFFSRVKQE